MHMTKSKTETKVTEEVKKTHARPRQGKLLSVPWNGLHPHL